MGRSILIIVWHLLAEPDSGFHDLASDFYDTHRSTAAKRRQHVRQLEALGFKVTLENVA